MPRFQAWYIHHPPGTLVVLTLEALVALCLGPSEAVGSGSRAARGGEGEAPGEQPPLAAWAREVAAKWLLSLGFLEKYSYNPYKS